MVSIKLYKHTKQYLANIYSIKIKNTTILNQPSYYTQKYAIHIQ